MPTYPCICLYKCVCTCLAHQFLVQSFLHVDICTAKGQIAWFSWRPVWLHISKHMSEHMLIHREGPVCYGFLGASNTPANILSSITSNIPSENSDSNCDVFTPPAHDRRVLPPLSSIFEQKPSASVSESWLDLHDANSRQHAREARSAGTGFKEGP